MEIKKFMIQLIELSDDFSGKLNKRFVLVGIRAHCTCAADYRISARIRAVPARCKKKHRYQLSFCAGANRHAAGALSGPPLREAR
eukprot:6195400-Pleurochrysis_carterae.AAC.3